MNDKYGITKLGAVINYLKHTEGLSKEQVKISIELAYQIVYDDEIEITEIAKQR